MACRVTLFDWPFGDSGLIRIGEAKADCVMKVPFLSQRGGAFVLAIFALLDMAGQVAPAAPEAIGGAMPAAASQPGQVWHYTLLEGSRIVDDCPICDRIPIVLPLRGTFDLRLLAENALFAYYALENISFSAGESGGWHYVVTGRGEFQIGGEVALRQELFLEVEVKDGLGTKAAWFTNASPLVSRLWPGFQVEAQQTNGTEIQTLTLDLAAAPIRDLWFSTVHPMTSGSTPEPFRKVSAGDLLSWQGWQVKSNAQLTGRLGIKPPVPDLGLDAVDVQPGGEIFFSMNEDVSSETLGSLEHGDVLSDGGRVVYRNRDLVTAFGPMLPIPNVGLDALQVREGGEVYFSIESSFFSQRLGVKVQAGDLLSGSGSIVRTEKELLSRFHPEAGAGSGSTGIGLDAVYVWPSEEIWFSTETGFRDAELGDIHPGDLLSDQGYLVYRNRELVGAFRPLEELADFGLDALFIVTDATPPAGGLWITRVERSQAEDWVRLEWLGRGRVFQVEGASHVEGPYLPCSPVLLERLFEEGGVSRFGPERYYRVRQW